MADGESRSAILMAGDRRKLSSVTGRRQTQPWRITARTREAFGEAHPAKMQTQAIATAIAARHHAAPAASVELTRRVTTMTTDNTVNSATVPASSA